MTGTYTDIVQVLVPSSAAPGESVRIEAQVKNIYPAGSMTITVTGKINDTPVHFGSVGYIVPYGTTRSFYQSFIMPNSNATIHVWSWFYTADGNWVQDDWVSAVVKVAGDVADGIIVSKWVNKSPEGFKLPMPASVNADGRTFEVGIQYKNISDSSYIAGVEVIVKDPQGITRAAPAIDWAGMSPNETLTVEYNICRVDKQGTWTVILNLKTQDGTILDSYTGTCIVASAFTGLIVAKWVNKAPEGFNLSIPAAVSADSRTFEVGAQYKNTSSSTYIAGVEVVVRHPQGVMRSSPAIDWAGISPGETLSVEYNICSVDKQGTWTITMSLKTQDGTVLDSYAGACITASGLLGIIEAKWVNKSPEGFTLPMPANVSADDNTFEIGVRYKNTSTLRLIAGAEVVVKDPQGIIRAAPVVDYTGMSPEESLSTEYNICRVDKHGDWTVVITFRTREGSVLDTYSGICIHVAPLPVISNLLITGYRAINPASQLLASGQVAVSPGSTLEVDVSFDYTVPAASSTELWTSLYIAPGRDYTIKQSVSLPAGTNQQWTGTIQVPITDEVGLRNYTYDILVEIPVEGLQAFEYSAVVITGMTATTIGGIAETIGLLITVMIVTMMMNMMGPMLEDPEFLGKAAGKAKEVGGKVIQIVLPKGS